MYNQLKDKFDTRLYAATKIVKITYTTYSLTEILLEMRPWYVYSSIHKNVGMKLLLVFTIA